MRQKTHVQFCGSRGEQSPMATRPGLEAIRDSQGSSGHPTFDFETSGQVNGCPGFRTISFDHEFLLDICKTVELNYKFYSTNKWCFSC